MNYCRYKYSGTSTKGKDDLKKTVQLVRITIIIQHIEQQTIKKSVSGFSLGLETWKKFPCSFLKQSLRREIQFPGEKTEAVNFTRKLTPSKAERTLFRRYFHLHLDRLAFFDFMLLFSLIRDITASSPASEITCLMQICVTRKLFETLELNRHLFLLRLAQQSGDLTLIHCLLPD